MMKSLLKLIPFGAMLLVVLACGEVPPKQWQKARLFEDKIDHPQALAADSEYLYFVTGGTVASQKEGTNKLLRMPLRGGLTDYLFSGGEKIIDADTLALDDEFVYFSANGLRKISKKDRKTVLLAEAFKPAEIILDRDNVYWRPFVGEGMNPAPLYVVSKSGGQVKTLTDPRLSANGLTVDENFLYWTQTDGIYKVSKTGGTAEKIYSAPAGEITGDLKADADNFYFRQGTSNRDLFKLAKSGGAAQILAKNVTRFWLAEKQIIFERFITSFDAAIFKIQKDGTNETELDREGYLADLATTRDKIYFSDVSRIYVLGF